METFDPAARPGEKLFATDTGIPDGWEMKMNRDGTRMLVPKLQNHGVGPAVSLVLAAIALSALFHFSL